MTTPISMEIVRRWRSYFVCNKIYNQFKTGKGKPKGKDQADDAELVTPQDTVSHFGYQDSLLLVFITKSLLSVLSLELTPSGVQSLGTWKETEKKHNFQRYFVFYENVTVIAQMNSVSLSHIIKLCLLM